jgi:monomeric sarcosine oxidase
MAPPAFDCVIVGGGIVGAAAAWRCAARGLRTLLLERHASASHDRGSSHGSSRIIRRTYAQEHYTAAMADAYALWTQAEAESGARVIRRTGGLDLARAGNEGLAAILRGCERFGVAHERLRASEVRARFPLLAPPDEYDAIYSPDAGVIHADRAREMLLLLAARAGCAVWSDSAVVNIDEDALGALRVDVQGGGTSARSVQAAACVLAAGPWTPALLGRCAATARSEWAGLPIGLKKTRAMLWEVAPSARSHLDSTPVFIDYSPDSLVYGMADPSGLLKVASHEGPFFENADLRDEQEDRASALQGVRGFIERALPHVAFDEGGPRRFEHCVYTMTPDEDFVIDTMPVGRSGKLVLGSCCSGHGFKLAPWAGEALATLAGAPECAAGAGGSWRELRPFRADRAFGSFDVPCVMGQRIALSDSDN